MTPLPTPARQRDTAAHTAPPAALHAWRELVATRGRYGTPNRHRPSGALVAVLEALRVDGELHIGAIARATHRDASNIGRWTLPHLHDLGLIERGDTVVLPGGGRPAQFWRLTRTGRRLADLFAAAAPGAVA